MNTHPARNIAPPSKAPGWDFLGDSGMSRQIRDFDWRATPLGPIQDWPQSLRTSVSLMLGSQHSMWIGWGPANTFLYNDAYVQVLGAAKHPWALGRPASVVWAEIWQVCGPLSAAVFERGEASFVDDVRLFMRRGEVLEETYYSFSYSPIRDESGQVAGLFCPSTDATAKNLNARRLAALSDLAAKALVEKTVGAACATASATLGKNLDDIPFSLLYLADSTGIQATLEQATQLTPGSPSAPQTVPLDAAPSAWPISEVVRSGRPRIVRLENLVLPVTGLAEQPIRHAIVLPIAARSDEQPLGALVAGVNPTRTLDAEYETFFTLVAGQIATAIANARAAEEERKRAEALAALDRAKTTFFSNVSHELRTPITLMLGPLDDMVRQEGDRILPENRALAEMARRNGLRLLKLVNTLLDFSRIEAGRIQANYVPTDLAAQTAELASAFRSAIEKAGLKFTVDCPPLPEPLHVDLEMWEKIVLNLLSNALKFTFEGEIAVSVRWTGGQAVLQVRDTGVGIPAVELTKIFERFHRVRETKSRTHEGTGIGLALVRELAGLHGGNVTAISQEGSGTTFTVTVRAGTAHLPADHASSRPLASTVITADAFVEEALHWLPEPTRQDLASAPTQKADHTNPRLLIADDNADMREYLRRILAEHYHVETVSDGRTALERCHSNRPDLLLTDVMMPQLDGFGVLERLRADERTRTLPIMMLSARAGEEARVEGLYAGADEYLAKPFSARELLARVRSLLTLAKIRSEGEERTSQILESMTDGFQVIDQQGRIRAYNAAAKRVFASQGTDADSFIGRRFDEILAGDSPGEDAGLTSLRRTFIERIPTTLEHYFAPWNRWFFVRHFPTPDGGVASFFQDITDRKRAESELVVAKEAAEAASRAKDDFLAALSHELRTPLTPVLMSAAALAAEPDLPNDAREQLAMIERNVQLEARLIDDLLDLTRISRGKLELRLEPTDAHLLLQQVEEIVRGDLAVRRLQFEMILRANQHYVLADAARLQQVFWNLLKNAVKFTGDGGRITIRTSNVTPQRLRISVEDTGRGIAADAIQSIFLPFDQGNLRGRHRFGGLGLGLSISKALVDLHRGVLRAESPGEGHGSVFSVEFDTTSCVSSLVPTIAANSEAKNLRLLLVEDHGPTLDVMSRLLKRAGHSVRTASSVADGLALADQEPFDLVISDLGLPDGPGYELMREIKRRHGLPGIALSGFGMETDLRESSEAGFVTHLVKPVDITDLSRAITAAVNHDPSAGAQKHAGSIRNS